MTEANVDLNKIKDRIAKLLRMAADSSSPEEAAIAAGRARSMMDKYQISAMSVESIDEVFLSKPASMFLKNFPMWMQTLGVQIARYNDCQATYTWGDHSAGSEGNAKAIEFRGYSSDVMMAIDMYKRLCSVIDRLAGEYQTKKGIVKYDPKIGAEFKRGAATAIIQTVQSLTIEREKIEHLTKGTSLVAFKMKGVEEKFGKMNYSNAAPVRNGVHHTHGYAEGVKVQVREAVK